MARVVISLKIFPADVGINLEDLKEKIKNALPNYASVYGFEEEPIAFGLVALIAHIILPEDLAGGLDEIESRIKGIADVSDIQTIMVRRA
ncbi:MAG: elongation factor 1-beta [Candidatus Bathyarchaeia archaeon]|nr:elongation factor 1-beta [Candidatus Bathyarchaeota archaeon]